MAECVGMVGCVGGLHGKEKRHWGEGGGGGGDGGGGGGGGGGIREGTRLKRIEQRRARVELFYIMTADMHRGN